MSEMPTDWRYKVPLKDGSFTPGQKEVTATSKLVNTIDFDGKSVLDIGTWDGAFALIALQNGAQDVTCMDIVIRPTIEFLKEHYEFDNMHLLQHSIYHYNPGHQFDVVLFYGVYYHLSDPLQALINCFKLSRGIVAVEGLMYHDDNPTMWLIDPYEVNPADNSNTYTLSGTLIKKLAANYGFEAIAEQGGKADPSSKLNARGTIIFERTGEPKSQYAGWSFPVAPLDS